MKKTEQRILHFLINPDISDSEFRSIGSLLMSESLPELLEFASQIRSANSPKNSNRSESRVFDEIEMLLRREVRAPVSVAMKMIYKEMNIKVPNLSLIHI